MKSYGTMRFNERERKVKWVIDPKLARIQKKTVKLREGLDGRDLRCIMRLSKGLSGCSLNHCEFPHRTCNICPHRITK